MRGPWSIENKITESTNSRFRNAAEVRKLFASWEEMFNDAEFKALLRNWAEAAKIANMTVERLLALVKTGTPMKAPLAERLVSAGLLTQILKAHRLAGNPDPRVTTRKELIEMGVPLRCNAEDSGRGGLQPATAYISEKLAAAAETRRVQGTRASRAEVREHTVALAAEFAQLTQEAQAPYVARAASSRDGRAKAKSAPPRSEPKQKHWPMFGMSLGKQPVPHNVVEDIFKAEAADTNEGGLSRTAEKLRSRLATSIYFTDQNDIPKNEKVVYNGYCGRAHTGLCCGKEPGQFRQTRESARIFEDRIRLAENIPEGSWLTLQVDRVDGSKTELHYTIANIRHAQPSMVFFTSAVRIGDEDEYQLAILEGQTMTHKTVCGIMALAFEHVSAVRKLTFILHKTKNLGRAHPATVMSHVKVVGRHDVTALEPILVYDQKLFLQKMNEEREAAEAEAKATKGKTKAKEQPEHASAGDDAAAKFKAGFDLLASVSAKPQATHPCPGQPAAKKQDGRPPTGKSSAEDDPFLRATIDANAVALIDGLVVHESDTDGSQGGASVAVPSGSSDDEDDDGQKKKNKRRKPPATQEGGARL